MSSQDYISGHPEHIRDDSESQPVERVIAEIRRDSSEARADAGTQIHRVARALVFPPVLGVILLALVVSGAADESVRDSGAALAALILAAGALILVPPLLYARSPDTYVKLQDRGAENLAQLLSMLSDSPPRSGEPAEPQPSSPQSGG